LTTVCRKVNRLAHYALTSAAIGQARTGPPVWDDGLDSLPDWDAMAQPEPEYMFNQEMHC
jgi:hypothetical protein